MEDHYLHVASQVARGDTPPAILADFDQKITQTQQVIAALVAAIVEHMSEIGEMPKTDPRYAPTLAQLVRKANDILDGLDHEVALLTIMELVRHNLSLGHQLLELKLRGADAQS